MAATKLSATLVALAITVGAPAAAQAPRPSPFPVRPPATQPGQPADSQHAALGAVWYNWQFEVRLGDLAASKGSSEEVKSLGRKMSEDNKQFGTRFTKLLSDRGINPATLPLPPESDRKRVEQEVNQIATRSGEDFDGEVVAFMTRNATAYEDDLKKAREATPGSDAELKKLLDEAEDAAEAHLAAAREDHGRRQGRRPPSR
jgi:putative membrane protein